MISDLYETVLQAKTLHIMSLLYHFYSILIAINNVATVVSTANSKSNLGVSKNISNYPGVQTTRQQQPNLSNRGTFASAYYYVLYYVS